MNMEVSASLRRVRQNRRLLPPKHLYESCLDYLYWIKSLALLWQIILCVCWDS